MRSPTHFSILICEHLCDHLLIPLSSFHFSSSRITLHFSPSSSTLCECRDHIINQHPWWTGRIYSVNSYQPLGIMHLALPSLIHTKDTKKEWVQQHYIFPRWKCWSSPSKGPVATEFTFKLLFITRKFLHPLSLSLLTVITFLSTCYPHNMTLSLSVFTW